LVAAAVGGGSGAAAGKAGGAVLAAKGKVGTSSSASRRVTSRARSGDTFARMSDKDCSFIFCAILRSTSISRPSQTAAASFGFIFS
jgi:hypothetical protein